MISQLSSLSGMGLKIGFSAVFLTSAFVSAGLNGCMLVTSIEEHEAAVIAAAPLPDAQPFGEGSLLREDAPGWTEDVDPRDAGGDRADVREDPPGTCYTFVSDGGSPSNCQVGRRLHSCNSLVLVAADCDQPIYAEGRYWYCCG